MFTKKNSEPIQLQIAIDVLYSELSGFSGDDDEYAKITDQLTVLYKLKEQDSPKRVSTETIVTVAGHLAGILLILNHERAHVVTSKALSFVMKLR